MLIHPDPVPSLLPSLPAPHASTTGPRVTLPAVAADEGGDPPCWAHLLDDDPTEVRDADRADPVGDRAAGVTTGDADDPARGPERRAPHLEPANRRDEHARAPGTPDSH